MVTQEETQLRRTALYEQHVALGARIVSFAGWAMPVMYGGIVGEHRRVRSTAGVFDVSHMGEFIVKGPDAAAELDRLTTNRVSAITEGRVQYTAMCYENGGFVDDLLIYRMPDAYMLVVNAANRDKDLEWVRGHVSGNVTVADVSDETALIALQGPVSEGVLSRVVMGDISVLPYYHWMKASVAGCDTTLSRTGYTGEDGFEVYCDPDDAPTIWDAILEAGAPEHVEPVGLGARDTLRLEMGYSLYGSEMGPDRTPPEAGLMWVTKLGKGDFIGREAIVRKIDAGIDERIVGFELSGRGVPRSGHPVVSDGEQVGHVTSGTFSPSLERGIGLAYVRTDIYDTLSVDIRGKLVEGRIVDLPFYKDGSVRRRR
ncbi:MAG: glycine cleavage system aminomethyltransferase GcvT [Candidatus Eisenbacteria bacterium]|nr:glycine cleavage system aminomethyltransferase GcvT [Candidatus Eisenbacteria bacterium]